MKTQLSLYLNAEQKARMQRLAEQLEREGVTNLRNDRHPDTVSLSKLVWFLVEEKEQEIENQNG